MTQLNLDAVSKEKYRPKKSNEEDEKKSEKRNDSKREMKAMEAIKIGEKRSYSMGV